MKRLVGKLEKQYRKFKTRTESFDNGNGLKKTTEIKIVPKPRAIKTNNVFNLILQEEIRKNPRKYTHII